MTEDSAIRIDCVTLQSLCTLPTLWSSSSVQPRNLSHRILGTRPRRSELESPTRPSYRVSLLPHHRRLVLGSLVSPRHLCLLDTGPRRSLTCPPWDGTITQLVVKTTAVCPAKATRRA